MRKGALSTYSKLEQINETTWRYINKASLGSYSRFIVQPVKVVVSDVDGRPISDEARREASHYLRNAVVMAISNRYPVTTESAYDTAEIVITISEVYKRGSQLGLSVEGEIRDSYSGVQVAAVVKSELGDAYLGEWWNKVSAKELMDRWAIQLREALDKAH